jgi:hypothetical protein
MKSPINLNNLDTSLTKEMDRSVLSSFNSKKAEDKPQLKFDPKKVDPSRSERYPENVISPINKVDGIHVRHASVPDPFEPKTKADK